MKNADAKIQAPTIRLTISFSVNSNSNERATHRFWLMVMFDSYNYHMSLISSSRWVACLGPALIHGTIL